METQVTTVNTGVTQNKTDIATINTNNGYYYFTDQLKHGNSTTVNFPAVSNNYPYSADNNSEFLMITLDGHYQIIYTDFYKSTNNVQFVIHDETNGNDLFVIKLSSQSDWSPITINAIVPINVDNGFGHAEIKMFTRSRPGTKYRAILGGAGFSSFYIKYLHA